MTAASRVRHLSVVVIVAFAALIWLGSGLQPAQGDEVGEFGRQVTEPAEVDAAVAGSPSNAAGLSLLAAAVVATLWNVAVGERRARRATQA